MDLPGWVLQRYSQSRHTEWGLEGILAASFDILGIIPGKPVERPWTVRPAALWIALLMSSDADSMV